MLLSQLTNGTDDAYTWDYFGGSASAWSTKNLQSGTEIGDNPDGIAFDPTNGDLYMSGDGTGIYSAWPKSNKCDTIQRVRGIMRVRRTSIQGIEVIVRLL